MMGTIELLKAMQEKCLRGGKYDDPLRIDKYKALEEAIKAIENQPKYEAALYEMSKYVQTCYRCKHEEDSPNCARNNGRDESICLNGHVDYYKNKAGLDGGTDV